MNHGLNSPCRRAGVVEGKTEIAGAVTVAGIGHEILDDVVPARLRAGIGVQKQQPIADGDGGAGG